LQKLYHHKILQFHEVFFISTVFHLQNISHSKWVYDHISFLSCYDVICRPQQQGGRTLLLVSSTALVISSTHLEENSGIPY
jgi:hypothetical protein